MIQRQHGFKFISFHGCIVFVLYYRYTEYHESSNTFIRSSGDASTAARVPSCNTWIYHAPLPSSQQLSCKRIHGADVDGATCERPTKPISYCCDDSRYVPHRHTRTTPQGADPSPAWYACVHACSYISSPTGLDTSYRYAVLPLYRQQTSTLTSKVGVDF